MSDCTFSEWRHFDSSTFRISKNDLKRTLEVHTAAIPIFNLSFVRSHILNVNSAERFALRRYLSQILCVQKKTTNFANTVHVPKIIWYYENWHHFQNHLRLNKKNCNLGGNRIITPSVSIYVYYLLLLFKYFLPPRCAVVSIYRQGKFAVNFNFESFPRCSFVHDVSMSVKNGMERRGASACAWAWIAACARAGAACVNDEQIAETIT